MIKRLFTLSLVLTFVLGLTAVRPASAATVITYNYVTYDNGMPQQLWATDYMSAKVTYESLGGDAYKLSFNHNGSTCVTLNAKSPGGNGTTSVQAGVKCNITGGEVVIIHGTPINPMPTKVSKDFRNDHTPNKYFLPFFSAITSVDYQSWGWTYSTCGNGSWTDNDATETLYNQQGPNGLMGDIQGAPAACQFDQGQPVTWFDPGDNRINPLPGDRLAIYCNQTPVEHQVVIYAVDNDSNGFLLGTFSNGQIISAGPSGIQKNLGVTGLLTVTGKLSNGVSYFWVTWNKGQYGGNGQGIWAKAVQCTFSS